MNTEQKYFSLVAENEFFVIINKLNNVNFHSEDGEYGVVVALEKRLKRKLYSVHRLDKMTSGLLILAKSSIVANDLSILFKTQQIEKYYLAISDKKPKKKQGLIKGGMEKSRRSMWKLTPSKENLAITQFFSFPLSEGKRLFVVKPKTGKTHQIRVALKSISSAICGDHIYADKDNQYDRGYLHAYGIAFNLYGHDYRFSCLPETGTLFLQTVFLAQLDSIGDVRQLSWPKV
ncbi:TIGR01621 family pseudouridine synthase [Psychromonas sp. psych-6C06]|uniref:TIGR01621 family pseudouridine synthase n=1 Tax=Psychromonas sp. psych-6C06 TaxID=2058089 RepID=UPI000C34A5F1|nr:TIGR01621 family pseudouridine synthase [Psychromonas sp. psych-6C06]PKF63567.1 TIGR01621 family pseudouridine synthase [Psychromonas sp. psych-6C06]